MLLYLIRHGETDWNKQKRMQGQMNIPLNDFGRHLAAETAVGLKDVPFDLAFTSPLIRAKETAEIILKDRDVPVVEDYRIQEMNFGIYEGLRCKGADCDIDDPEFHNFFDAPEKYRAPKGAETFEDFSKRLGDFLDEISDKDVLKDSTILVSTHGAALCGLLRLIKNEPLQNFWGKSVSKNCGVSIVEVKDHHFTVLAENITYYTEQVADW